MILDENADFTQMGPGNLQVCLTVSNYVLKDAAVNLSVKETGLRVASSILENNTEVQMIDLVRLTVNMLKTNYSPITELRSAVIWTKGVSSFKPDFSVEYLPTNPWIHQPFEGYDSMRPAQLMEKWKV